MLHIHAKPGKRDDLLRLFERLGVLAVAIEDRGLMSAELAVAVDDEDELVLVGEWASREQFERWLDGPVPGGFLDAAGGLLARKPSSRLYHVVESVS